MKTITTIMYPSIALFTLACVGISRTMAAPPPDATLYTTYNIDTAHTNVTWVVCGSLPRSSGCYGAGSIGPFGKVGALLEGNPSTNISTNTVTRAIYVVDVASGTNKNEVVLDVYTKRDAITPDFDTVTVSLSHTISLPIVGGTTAKTSMAANKKFVFVGTNRSPNALEINKRTFSIVPLGGFSPPINVSAITANQYGYMTLSYGSFRGFDTAFIVCDPDGNVVEDGGGSQLMLNTAHALLPSTLP